MLRRIVLTGLLFGAVVLMPFSLSSLADAQQASPGEESLTNSERVVADIRAKNLAYAAYNGDARALESLTAEASQGVPSAQFGLSLYYELTGMPRIGEPTNRTVTEINLGPLANTDVFDDYMRERDPKIAAMLDDHLNEMIRRDSKWLRRREQIETQRKIVRLLKAAGRKGDPAAIGDLGKLYLQEVIHYAGWMLANDGRTFLENPDILNSGQNLIVLETARAFCAQANKLLSDAAEKGWAEAYVYLNFIYLQRAPFFLKVGCGQGRADYDGHFLLKAVELGSPKGILGLIEVFRQMHVDASVDNLERRLRGLAEEGDLEAKEFVIHILPTLNN